MKPHDQATGWAVARPQIRHQTFEPKHILALRKDLIAQQAIYIAAAVLIPTYIWANKLLPVITLYSPTS